MNMAINTKTRRIFCIAAALGMLFTVQHAFGGSSNVHKPVTEAEIEAMLSVNKAGSALYWKLLASEGKDKAIAEAVNFYKSQPIVKDAGVSVGGVWVIYTIGIEGGFIFSTSRKKGGGAFADKPDAGGHPAGRLSETEIKAMLAVDEEGALIYMRLLAPEGEEKAIAAAVDYFKSQPLVEKVGVSVSGVWVRYTNGITGGFSFYRPGTR